MTHLRKMMLEELQRRNYAETTTRHYIRAVEDFARRFNRPPDRLGLRPIRECQAELFQKRKLFRAPLRNIWRLSGFSIPRLSRRPGALPRLPNRKDHFIFRRSFGSLEGNWRQELIFVLQQEMEMCSLGVRPPEHYPG